MKKIKYFLITALFATTLIAQNRLDKTQAVKQSIDDQESYPVDVRPYLENFYKVNGIDPTKIDASKTPLKKTAWNFTVGSKQNWWAADWTTGVSYLTSATCRAVGLNCYIFVEDSLWTTRVDQNAVDKVNEAFNLKTPANPTKGIYQTDVETFGAPPDVDGDPRIIILILNIRDSYKNKGNGYVAGYFSPYNENTYGSQSNKSEFFYLDANPLDLRTADGLNTGMSTTAHEFQHMIHSRYHTTQETFFNEAWSLVAEVINGYGLYNQSYFLNKSNRYFMYWETDPAKITEALIDYSRAARFSLYLYEQFGVNLLKNFVTNTGLTGVDGLNDVLSGLGSTRRFKDIVTDWWIANYLNDKTVNSKWGFDYAGIPKVKSQIISTPNITARQDSVFKMSAEYITYTNGNNLYASFSTQSNANIKVKAIETGTAPTKVVDVGSEGFSEPGFGTSYNNVTFMVYHDNMSDYNQGPFNFNYTSTGSGSVTTTLLKYDDADTTPALGAWNLSPNDTCAVLFDGAVGMKLQKIIVGLRNDLQITGRVYLTTANGKAPLGKPISTPFTLKGNIKPSAPFTAPWPNMVEYDISGQNIDASKNFAVAFVYTGTGSNNIVVVGHSPSEFYHSYTYLGQPSSGSAGWYYLQNSSTSVGLYVVRALISNGTSDVTDEAGSIPTSFSLDQNYPNPFNPTTTIKFSIPAVETYRGTSHHVSLKVFDLLGREVAALVNEDKSPGNYEVKFDASRLTSATYFYNLTANGKSVTKKMILMK